MIHITPMLAITLSLCQASTVRRPVQWAQLVLIMTTDCSWIGVPVAVVNSGFVAGAKFTAFSLVERNLPGRNIEQLGITSLRLFINV